MPKREDTKLGCKCVMLLSILITNMLSLSETLPSTWEIIESNHGVMVERLTQAK